MLIQLSVENIAIIERLTVELEEGLNILTGETGAGKSILIDAVNALLGGRVSRDIIRAGEEKARVEAVFRMPPKLNHILEDMGIDSQDDGTLIMSRQFSASGKNICRINGNLVTVSQMKEIGEYLIDIHGQNDNQSLLRNKAQIDYLDMFSGERLLTLKDEYQKLLSSFNEAGRKINEMKMMEQERARLEDLYRYQSEEIAAAALKSGEEQELLRQSSILSNAEGIMEALETAYRMLVGEDDILPGALEQLRRAQVAIDGISVFDKDFGMMSESIVDAIDKLEEAARNIRIKKDQINYNPELQQVVEERLSLIGSLKRKYGNSVEEIISYGEEARRKLEEITNSESLLERLIEERNKLDRILFEKAGEIHKMRLDAASVLTKRVNAQLHELEMEKACFDVDIRFDETRKYHENGLDSIEFLFSPNPGEGFKPLNRIASGGEMSRIMLAIKTILADVDETGVLIFDEIDTGVSGRAALKVGEKLVEVSGTHQVVCVTHHAQIASLAKSHYYISKRTEGERTTAHVKKISGQNRESEIARLLSGEDSENTTKLAREMIQKGDDLRSRLDNRQKA